MFYVCIWKNLRLANLDSAQPQSERKVKTISVWEPVKNSIAEGIIDKFKQNQSELIDAMEKATDLAKKSNRNSFSGK